MCLGGSCSPTPSDGSHGYLCPAGYSCPVGSASEAPCEPGTYSPAPGAAHCITCPKGTMCSSSATQEPAVCPAGEDGENKLRSTVYTKSFNPPTYSSITRQQLNVKFGSHNKHIFDKSSLHRSFMSCWDSPASAVPFRDFQQPDRSPLSLCLHTLYLWILL